MKNSKRVNEAARIVLEKMTKMPAEELLDGVKDSTDLNLKALLKDAMDFSADQYYEIVEKYDFGESREKPARYAVVIRTRDCPLSERHIGYGDSYPDAEQSAKKVFISRELM